MEAPTEKRILCRFYDPANDAFTLIAEQPEMPSIGEHFEIELHIGWQRTQGVVFVILDLAASDPTDDFILVDVEVHRVG